MLKKISPVAAVMMLLLGTVGFSLLQNGFHELQNLRQLERVPASQAGYILPGETNITARAEILEGSMGTINSFHTKTPCLYYRYTHEIQKTDSDGKSRWETVDSREDSNDFTLADNSGRAYVRARSSHHLINWRVHQSFSETKGDHRYTEWRIEPGQSLFVFANAHINGSTIELRFDHPGFYTPIISNFSQTQNQSEMGGSSLLMLWGGLAVIGLTVLSLMFTFKIHRLLVYLMSLTFILALILVGLSHSMMHQDIANGLDRYLRQLEAAEMLSQKTLQKYGLDWRGWNEAGDFLNEQYAVVPQKDRERLKAYRTNVTLGQLRLSSQMLATPERWLLWLWGFELPQAPTGIPPNDWQDIQSKLAKIPNTRLNSSWVFFAVIASGILAPWLSFTGYRQIKLKRLIENIPTSPVAAVSCGLAEVKGMIFMDNKADCLKSPLTKSHCVWYFYHEQEKRGSGKNAKWVTIKKETKHRKFYCKDDTGRIAVNAEGAEIISCHREEKTEGKYHYTEITLRLHEALYAIGLADIDPEQPDQLFIGKTGYFEPFILSNRNENEIMLKKAQSAMWRFNFAFSALLLALLAGFGLQGGFAATDFLIAATAAPVYMIAITLIIHYNDLVYLRRRAERNFSNIDVSMKKRHDLLSDLQDIIKRYLSHEQTMQEEIATLRSHLKESDKNAQQLARYLSSEQKIGMRLQALLENYPKLKAEKLMLAFMRKLASLESETALFKQGYNDAVELYNTRVGSIPDIFFARLFGFKNFSYIGWE